MTRAKRVDRVMRSGMSRQPPRRIYVMVATTKRMPSLLTSNIPKGSSPASATIPDAIRFVEVPMMVQVPPTMAA